MKKQFILGFLCCLFLTFSINTLANYLYSAKDIEYKNENVDATNVQEALNELYEIENELNSLKKEGNASPDKILKGSSAVVQGELINGTYEETKVYYLGTGTNFNIKNLLPEIDYTTLTNENFIVGANNFSGGGTSHNTCGYASRNGLSNGDLAVNSSNIYPSYSYNNSTGILTITNTSGTISLQGQTCISGDYTWRTYKTSSISLNMKVYLVIGTIINK